MAEGLVAPSSTTGLLEVFRRRYLLKLLVRREISARYQGSFLGLLWSYINPLSQFFIYWFVMGRVMGLHKDVENFPVHIFTGLVVVHFFVETFSAGTRSIVRNRQIVQKMAVPREMFPVASMLVSGFHVLPQTFILVIVCLSMGWSPDAVGMAAFVLALGIIATLGTALALFFSAANVFLRDMNNAVNVLTNFVRFGVPMIYPFTRITENFSDTVVNVYLANPICQAVLLMQRAFWVGTTDDPAETTATHLPEHLFAISAGGLAASLLLLGLAQLTFSRLEGRIPERL